MTSFELTSPDADFKVEATKSDGQVRVRLGKDTFNITLKKEGPRDYLAIIGERRVRFSTEEVTGQSVRIRIGDDLLEFKRSQEMATLRSPSAVGTSLQSERTLNSPMPGRVVSVSAREGQTVAKGDPLMVVESMKMESVLRSDRDARVERVLVAEGDSVKRGQPLVRYSVEKTR
jgi:3-methylcrotonyl-CoA carboxylase alpha subunit